MATFTLVRRTTAPPETVFEVYTDHRSFPDYTPLRRVELEREGDPPPNGVGAIRVLHGIGPAVREEVVTYEPPRSFSYRMLSGAPLEDHVGTVTIEPAEVEGRQGSRVAWAVDTTPTVPIGKGIVLAVAKRVVAGLVDGGIKEAERRSG
ncbi:MAG: SRPBCC family protein [Solirubrobacterales bacterium]